MSLGGQSETHSTLPLQPDAPPGAQSTVALGAEYELCVLQCVGHYARAHAEESIPAKLVVSDYPLPLLHVQVAVRRIASAVMSPGTGSLELAPDVRDGLDEFGFGTSSPPPGSNARQREAAELGDAIERMLLG